MVVFRALSIDGEMVKGLGGRPITGKVHSVFKGAVNLTDGQGRLLALVSASSGNAPYTIRVDTPMNWSWNSHLIRVGDMVRIDQEMILVGRTFMIILSGAETWSPAMPALPKDRALMETNSRLFGDVVLTLGKAGGMLRAYTPEPWKDHSANGRVFSEVMELRVENLRGLLLAEQYDQAVEAGLKLVGLGAGLTPAGDDFLSGLILTFHLGGGFFPEGLRSFGRCLSELTAGRTTDLSYFMLRNAAEGRAGEPVMSVLQAYTQADRLRITAAAQKLLQIGSTSGTDLALGMLEGFQLALKQDGEWGE